MNDYDFYNVIYGLPFSDWYNGHGYFYSPLFAVIFYPFHLSFMLYLVSYIVFTGADLVLLIKVKAHWSIKLLTTFIIFRGWIDLNFDIFITFFTLLFMLNPRSRARQFLVAMMVFKPIYVLALIPLYFHVDLDKGYLNVSRNRFLEYIFIGLALNYCYFIVRPDVVISFLENGLQMKANGIGPAYYLTMFNYEWFWLPALTLIQKKNQGGNTVGS